MAISVSHNQMVPEIKRLPNLVAYQRHLICTCHWIVMSHEPWSICNIYPLCDGRKSWEIIPDQVVWSLEGYENPQYMCLVRRRSTLLDLYFYFPLHFHRDLVEWSWELEITQSNLWAIMNSPPVSSNLAEKSPVTQWRFSSLGKSANFPWWIFNCHVSDDTVPGIVDLKPPHNTMQQVSASQWWFGL
jgi:hypothetical protein